MGLPKPKFSKSGVLCYWAEFIIMNSSIKIKTILSIPVAFQLQNSNAYLIF